MALGADLTCAVVPVLAGGGLAVRASEKALISVYKRIKLLENISNPALRKAIDKLYKVNARVGDGSSMDAYRYEKATGILLLKTGHGQKLIDSRTHLQRLFHNPNIAPQDKVIIRNVLINIQNALSGL